MRVYIVISIVWLVSSLWTIAFYYAINKRIDKMGSLGWTSVCDNCGKIYYTKDGHTCSRGN